MQKEENVNAVSCKERRRFRETLPRIVVTTFYLSEVVNFSPPVACRCYTTHYN